MSKLKQCEVCDDKEKCKLYEYVMEDLGTEDLIPEKCEGIESL